MVYTVFGKNLRSGICRYDFFGIDQQYHPLRPLSKDYGLLKSKDFVHTKIFESDNGQSGLNALLSRVSFTTSVGVFPLQLVCCLRCCLFVSCYMVTKTIV